MVSINYATREVSCKIVYYGPGLSGKTTNLQYVHRKVPPETKGKLISLATDADRTLYFDFLPINIGSINGFAAKFQLYTVPGQVYYNATRKLVLRGVDGLVFVADSQPDKMDENIESLSNLKENLAEYGYRLEELPIVIQYNKQDLPGVLTPEQIRPILNTHGWVEYSASATEGFGVFDTLKCILKLVLDKAKSGGTVPSSTPVTAAVSTPAAAVAAPAPAPLRVTAVPVSDRPVMPQVAAMAPSMPSAPIATPEPAMQPEPSYSDQSPFAAVARTEPVEPTLSEPPQYYREPIDAAPEEEAPPANKGYRPFPGNTLEDEVGMNRRQRQETLGSRRLPAGIESAGPLTMADEPGDRWESAGTRISPTAPPRMEPSRKVDKTPKKRSFFRRLFGLK
jgi:signal recognition particle receptor subunit beta